LNKGSEGLLFMKSRLVILLLGIALLISGCGGSSSSGSADSKAGEQLFTQGTIGSQAGCNTCHSLKPDVIIIGPSLAGIGAKAATLVAGQSAEETLREAIINPDALITEGFPAGIMPKGYAQELTDEQIDQLVAYMLTLN
jgi:mono/diheme cytochrome c family protein